MRPLYDYALETSIFGEIRLPLAKLDLRSETMSFGVQLGNNMFICEIDKVVWKMRQRLNYFVH